MATPTRTFDRTMQDVGNVLALEHLNVCVPDQQAATVFYIAGLGFTRDPYVSVAQDNIWVNIGRQQIHLPTREPQVFRGEIGLVVPDLDALKRRLDVVGGALGETNFAWSVSDGGVEVTGPWGNIFRCVEASEAFGGMRIGVPYVRLWVPQGTAEGIARFYREVMGAPSTLEERAAGPEASVQVGTAQTLRFAESAAPTPTYDGHHVAIYTANFSGPHAQLQGRGLVTEESNDHQYRFVTIVDPASGEALFDLEHEVRSVTHPMFMRPLVNRDPGNTLFNYAKGSDALGIG